ncbi:isoflavone reductase [Fusarium circinatum]|uniref:Isoflavone reductase n=1 Tax=Fusarium circinatum TaxID=48490 RepID=A0A8H5WTQ0_FUSCI|nr:isoflavone reductase [Fusarium circinatum]
MKVAILGATGQNGTSIVNGLLASTKTRFDIAALVRPSSLKKPNVIELQSKGINIVSFNLDDPEDHLAAQLKGIDVLIVCCLIDEAILVNAAKKAGVKRYVPCFYATVMPRGIQTLRDTKETTLDHIQRLHLDYTVIDVGLWYQISLPRLPSGRIDRNLFLYNSAIGGSGDIPCARTDSRDVGRYVARIITDPRTLNQKLFAYTDLRTQHELYDTRTADEIDDGIARTKDDPYKMMDYYQFTYQKSYDIMGENTPDYARYLGYQISKDLYPDMEGISFEDFFEETLEHGLKPMHEEFADMLRGSSSFVFQGEAITK